MTQLVVLEEVGPGRHRAGVLGTSHRMRADVALERYVAFHSVCRTPALTDPTSVTAAAGYVRSAWPTHVWDRRRWNCHDDHTDIRRPWRLNDARAQAGGDSCVADLVVSQVHPVAGRRQRATDGRPDEAGSDDDSDLRPGGRFGDLAGAADCVTVTSQDSVALAVGRQLDSRAPDVGGSSVS